MIRAETVRDVIMRDYAMLIADAALGRRHGLDPANRSGGDYWGFVRKTFARLRAGELTPSALIRENKLLVKAGATCAYCGASNDLQWEHVVPLGLGGPDSIDNLVRACSPCNLSKGRRDPYGWFKDEGRKSAEIPRLVMGKLLKMLLEAHSAAGTLDAAEFPVGSSALRRRDLVLVFTVHG